MNAPQASEIETTGNREVLVGGISVRRSLPRRNRRMVGASCFVDHMGPLPVTKQSGPNVGPHPHMGLQTVTWLIEGETLHRDSLGSEQLIRPGELNLMTAGSGLSHAEEATYGHEKSFHEVQLWVALPEVTRYSIPEFAHHANLPSIEVETSSVTVLIGEMLGEQSAARHNTPLVGVGVGVGLAVSGEVVLSLRVDFEYALVPLDGSIRIDDRPVEGGGLAYLAPGRSEVRVGANGRARAMLLGGEPFPESILMWWNFVARTRDEIDAAFSSWQADDGRFGRVTSKLSRIPTMPPYWQPR